MDDLKKQCWSPYVKCVMGSVVFKCLFLVCCVRALHNSDAKGGSECLYTLKVGYMCGSGSWLSLRDMQGFLYCHFDLVILRFGKPILREDDASQNDSSVLINLKVARRY